MLLRAQFSPTPPGSPLQSCQPKCMEGMAYFEHSHAPLASTSKVWGHSFSVKCSRLVMLAFMPALLSARPGGRAARQSCQSSFEPGLHPKHHIQWRSHRNLRRADFQSVVQAGSIAPTHRHICHFSSEHFRNRPANATAAAGDNGNLVFQSPRHSSDTFIGN